MEENKKLSDLVKYVIANKDKDFNEKGFCEADGLVLSMLSYIDWSGFGIDYPSDETKSLGDVCRWILEDKPRQGVLSEDEKDMLNAIRNSERFKNIQIADYCDVVRERGSEGVENFEDLVQFQAVTFIYKDENGEDCNFISYRGTTPGMEGWCEDFNMAYDTMTDAQELAVQYLEDVASRRDGKIQTGGHSKGGNDAMYAYLFCDEEIRKRFRNIYTFDGPGFNKDTVYVDEYGTEHSLDPNIYNRMLDMLIAIAPFNSVVGQLLDEVDCEFVDTNTDGKDPFADHDAYKWSLDPESGTFKPREQNEVSRYINKIIDDMMVEFTPEERKLVMVLLWETLYKYSQDNNFHQTTAYIKKNIRIVLFECVLNGMIGAIKDPEKAIKLLMTLIDALGIAIRDFMDPGFTKIRNLIKEFMIECLPGLAEMEDKINEFMKNRNLEDYKALWNYIAGDPVNRMGEILGELLQDSESVWGIVKLVSPFTRDGLGTIIDLIVYIVLCETDLLLDIATVGLQIICVNLAITFTGIVMLIGIADFIKKNLEKLMELAKMAVEYACEKIVEFVDQMKNAIYISAQTAITYLVFAVTDTIERNKEILSDIKDTAIELTRKIGELAGKNLMSMLHIANPFLYSVVRIVAAIKQDAVQIDMPRLERAVEAIERLANEIQNIDDQLDGLYIKLCVDNIEQGEGIFTSIAEMFHLASADIKVDQGNVMRRRARAIRELYTGYNDVEVWMKGQLEG